jgi:hypothetical protein
MLGQGSQKKLLMILLGSVREKTQKLTALMIESKSISIKFKLALRYLLKASGRKLDG